MIKKGKFILESLYYSFLIVPHSCLQLGFGGPGHSPIFGTPLDPNLNLVSVHLDHGSVLTSVSLDHGYVYLKRDKHINLC